MTDHTEARPGARVRVVDGNALAGVLDDVFRVDATLLQLCCGGCGVAGPLAGTVVEDDGVASIVRCRTCTHTLLTVLRRPEGVSLVLGSLARIDVREAR